MNYILFNNEYQFKIDVSKGQTSMNILKNMWPRGWVDYQKISINEEMDRDSIRSWIKQYEGMSDDGLVDRNG